MIDNTPITPAEEEIQPELTNEIGLFGKWIAGILIVAFTLLPLLAIIAFWPDRLPGTGDKIARYSTELFNVRLMDTISAGNMIKKDSVLLKIDTTQKMKVVKDSPAIVVKKEAKKDSLVVETAIKKNMLGVAAKGNKPCVDIEETISVNTLLLLLVAIAAFLGNMVHIATSFTTFVGAEKFKRSWILWYCVKPFTAAALGLVLYFSFRGGFLNSSSDVSNLNLYGIITLAALSGLFTDIATQKLKEVFSVIFKPTDPRPNKL
jgi:hypothetical protein